MSTTVVHDFNGNEVNEIHGLYGRKGYDEALYWVNKRHDFTGIHYINGKFPYDYIFLKNHAREDPCHWKGVVYYVPGPWGYIQAWFSSQSHYRLLQMCTINLLYVKLPRKSFPLLRNTITNALQKNEPEFGILLVPNLRQFLVAGCNFVNKGLFDCLWFCINLEGNLGYT